MCLRWWEGRKGKSLSSSLSTSLHLHFHFSLSLFSEASAEKRVLSMESFPSKLGLAGRNNNNLEPILHIRFSIVLHVRHRLNPCLCSGCSLGIGGWRILRQMFGSLWLFIFRQGATFKIFSCNVTPFSCY